MSGVVLLVAVDDNGVGPWRPWVSLSKQGAAFSTEQYTSNLLAMAFHLLAMASHLMAKYLSCWIFLTNDGKHRKTLSFG